MKMSFYKHAPGLFTLYMVMCWLEFGELLGCYFVPLFSQMNCNCKGDPVLAPLLSDYVAVLDLWGLGLPKVLFV